jgi:Tol biopolymer transport system component
MSHRHRIAVIAALTVVIGLASALAGHSAFSASGTKSRAFTMPGKNGAIAFKRNLGDGSTVALFAIGADGKGARQLTRPEQGVEDDQPDWSPNGSLLVFHRGVPDSPVAIYTIKSDGSELTRVSPPCTASGPGIETVCEDGEGASFLPDGKRVVYTRATGNVKSFGALGDSIEHSDIVVRDLSGGDPQVLVRSRPYQGDLLSPNFSPDGSQLVYVRSNSPRRGRQVDTRFSWRPPTALVNAG